MNTRVPQIVRAVSGNCPIEVWHQTGARQLSDVERAYAGFTAAARVDAFIEDMAGGL